jgi:hypothetical protein
VGTQPTVLIVEVVCGDTADGIDCGGRLWGHSRRYRLWRSSVRTQPTVSIVEVVCEDTADGIDCGGRL